MEKTQIISLIQKSLDFNLFDAKWLPCSAKFVILGGSDSGGGSVHVFELCHADAKLVAEVEKPVAFNCGTFGASYLHNRHLATGDFEGRLEIWDLDALETPLFSVKAHSKIINSLDGIGGVNAYSGTPQIVTGSRDGSIKLWDCRQEKLIATMEPAPGEARQDCWAVAFGQKLSTEERMVCAGFDNGDIKLIDLRTMSLQWETNIGKGVCSLEFDTKEGLAKRLVATSLESEFHVYDLQDELSHKTCPSVTGKAHMSTVWTVKHLPQKNAIFMTTGGNGSLCLWKQHVIKQSLVFNNSSVEEQRQNSGGNSEDSVGSLTQLQGITLSQQPITSFDWSPDKDGLCVCTSFDKTLRVLIATNVL